MSERGGWSQSTGGGRGYRDNAQGDNSPSSALGAYVPPNSIEAEQSTLGAMLIEAAAVTKAARMLTVEDFYRPTHQTLFDVILALTERGQPIDLITVQEELKNRDKLDSIGGISYLTALFETCPTAANVEYYAKIVQEKSILRNMVSVSLEIIGMARGEVEDINDVITQAQTALTAASGNMRHDRPTQTTREIGREFYDYLLRAEEARANGLQVTAGVRTGFPQFDDMTGGLPVGELTVIAGRPSMGKTACVCWMARNVAFGNDPLPSGVGRNVMIFSLEMSNLQLYERFITGFAEVEGHIIRSARYDLKEAEAIHKAQQILDSDRISIADATDMTPPQMIGRCQEVEARYGRLGLIVVDYLGLLSGDAKKQQNRAQEIGALARNMKSLARRMGVPLVLLSQLSRKVEERRPQRPMLSDLHESGDIEAAADIVALLYRKRYYDRQAAPSELKDADNAEIDETEIIVAKNKHGRTGVFKVGFVPQFVKFVPAPPKPPAKPVEPSQEAIEFDTRRAE